MPSPPRGAIEFRRVAVALGSCFAQDIPEFLRRSRIKRTVWRGWVAAQALRLVCRLLNRRAIGKWIALGRARSGGFVGIVGRCASLSLSDRDQTENYDPEQRG